MADSLDLAPITDIAALVAEVRRLQSEVLEMAEAGRVVVESAEEVFAESGDEIARLQGEADTMRAWASPAAADENANAADLAEVTKERDIAVDAFHRCRQERDEARAALAEAEATIANERGEGPPPSEGWRYIGDGVWSLRAKRQVLRLAEVPDNLSARWRWVVWGQDRADAFGTAPTARAAMKAADEALRVRE